MNFTFEHAALNYRDVKKVVAWYVEHLGLEPVLSTPSGAAFLADSSGRTVFELYSNPAHPFIDGDEKTGTENQSPAPLTLHNAFVVNDVSAARDHLLKAGATLVSGPGTTPAGDELCMLVDPWGIGLQVLKRSTPLP